MIVRAGTNTFVSEQTMARPLKGQIKTRKTSRGDSLGVAFTLR